MKNNVIETVMGAVVLVVACFFLYFAYSHSGYQGNGSGLLYKARFDRIDGLIVGSDVKMSGVKVGTIRSLYVDPKSYMAEIMFSVSKELQLPKDTSAEIVSNGLMGEKYLALVPGGEEESIPPGGEIVHTQSAISLEGMISQAIYGKKSDGDGKAKEETSHPEKG